MSAGAKPEELIDLCRYIGTHTRVPADRNQRLLDMADLAERLLHAGYSKDEAIKHLKRERDEEAERAAKWMRRYEELEAVQKPDRP